MHDAHDCHRKAEALATLAVMFPESAHRYRAKEQHWRDLEAEAQTRASPATKRRQDVDRSGAPSIDVAAIRQST